MAIFPYLEIFLITLIIIFFYFCNNKIQKRTLVPTNWPVVGMLPALLQNSHRIHDFITEILNECGGSFEFKGPWFCNMDMLITCDPSNIHHIFSRNFSNYPKGPEFRKIFEILGDGIFNADFELWEFHRRTTMSFMTNSRFYSLLERSVWEKVEKGLFPVLDHFQERETDVDLQDVFQRFTFDSICKLVLDYDPESLSVDLPDVPSEKGFNSMIESLLYRHLVPENVWKIQKWLGIGKERRLKEAWNAFDEFIYPQVRSNEENKKIDFNLLNAFKSAIGEKNVSSRNRTDFLKDTALNLMLAGRDTTSTCLTWLFYLLAINPSSEIKILEEIERELGLNEDKKLKFFNVEESRKLVYLHGALCESLRLFPPVALEHKAPIRPDTLPSGNFILENTKVIVSFYSMGRMEGVWGKDCLEFKPERWILPRGGVKHEPSYKFPAFNAGPRTCIGREMAFIQMKMVASAVMYNYRIRLAEGIPILPRDSIILQTKQGLNVRLSRRNA